MWGFYRYTRVGAYLIILCLPLFLNNPKDNYFHSVYLILVILLLN